MPADIFASIKGEAQWNWQSDRVIVTHQDIGNLIVRVGCGDRSAFLALYDATSARLLAIIMRMGQNRADAEDILQDVFLKIWSNASRYDPQAARPWAWLIAIARYRAIDIVRERGARPVADKNDISDFADLLSDGRGSDVHLNERDLLDRESLKNCLETLAPNVRAMIIDAYLGGWSREELADRYNRPVNTVKTQLQRGLSALKNCLDGKP